MQGRPAHVVLDVGVGAGLQQSLSGVRAGVARRQVQGSFARAVCLVVEVCTLVDEVIYDVGRGVLLFLAVARLQSSPAAGRDHQRSESICGGDRRGQEREAVKRRRRGLLHGQQYTELGKHWG